MAQQQERSYSIVVFGATGFTGKRVLAELLKIDADKQLGAPLAAAGRSHDSLAAVLKDLGATERVSLMAGVDVSNFDSVLKMARSARLIINCVGPYRLYGEAVVRAAAEAGTHYVDICGEPEFMERMEFKYNDAAAAAGCYIASACAMDSMPADMGTIIAQRQFAPPAVPSSVEMYLTLKPGKAGYNIHYATWHSAVLGLGSVANLRKVRSEIKAAGKAPAPAPVGPKPKAPAALAFCNHPAVQRWHLPFPGADASVVRRTQGYLQKAGEPTVHFVARFTLATKWYAYVAAAVGATMASLASYSWGRSLLLAQPGLFSYGLVSHEGPSEEQMANTSTETTLIARGYSQGPPSSPDQQPDREVVMRLSCGDPGYLATSTFVTQAAMAVLQEQGKLPPPGCYTGGALLRNTSYPDRLVAQGMRIEKVSDKKI